MSFQSISLYGSDSLGYMTLMSYYAAHAAYRFSHILTYFSEDVPYEDMGPPDDPPWRRPKSFFSKDSGFDDIEILFYLPIHKDETLRISAEAFHIDNSGVLREIAAQPAFDFFGSDDSANASDPVHYSNSSSDIWRHARVALRASAIPNLGEFINGQTSDQYYIFRFRIFTLNGTPPNLEVVGLREENGVLLIEV